MKKTDIELLELPPLTFKLPLSGEDWIGGDGAVWRDVALDSTSEFVLAWVRRRLEDGKYFLVVSVVRGHILAYEITLKEARELYGALPNKAPYERSFDVTPAEKEDEET